MKHNILKSGTILKLIAFYLLPDLPVNSLLRMVSPAWAFAQAFAQAFASLKMKQTNLSLSASLLPCLRSFPDSSVGKEPACNAGDLGLILGLGRSPGEGKGYPLQYSSDSFIFFLFTFQFNTTSDFWADHFPEAILAKINMRSTSYWTNTVASL